MIHFKCSKCGSIEHSSCIQITPCQKCGGKIEVESIGEKENENDNTKRKGKVSRCTK